MNVLSLFDGMSCGRVALKGAGITVNNYYSSEIDKFAIKIADKNFPSDSGNRLGNICDIKSIDLPVIDLIIGGSPCQSFSRGGDNSGFDGKSKLFWEFIRILKSVKPRYFLLENVIMKKEWENIITEAIGVDPIKIDSKFFSAQKRQRLYWTNIPVNSFIDKNIFLSNIIKGNREEILNNPLVLEYLDNGIRIKNGTSLGYLIANEFDSVNLEVPKSLTRRGRVGKNKTNTLNTACNYGVILNNKLCSLNINDFEKLQTLPENYTAGVSINQRKKMIGNGWTVDVISHILKGIK
jgi:DNA (cytosine-5)-methyltransferase 3A